MTGNSRPHSINSLASSCARAAIGHDTAALPTSEMNSLRAFDHKAHFSRHRRLRASQAELDPAGAFNREDDVGVTTAVATRPQPV
jgi:hypothetical protein